MKIKDIKNYKPYKGFYDLRDYDIPKKVFVKLWEWQDMLSHMSERKEYFKKYHKSQWEKAKEYSAIYQQELLSYNINNNK